MTELSRGAYAKADHYAHMREEGAKAAAGPFRGLSGAEIEALVANGNRAGDWASVLVSEPFDPSFVRDSQFEGLVRLGAVERGSLAYHELELPVGVYRSRLVESDVGDHCAIHNAALICRYKVGPRSIIFNVDELLATDRAKFGEGFALEGEGESALTWIDLVNEAGGRAVLPFAGMLPADAWLWASRKADAALQERLVAMTQALPGARRGRFGEIGEGCVIRSSRILKDVLAGPSASIRGANAIMNVSILSTREEPVQVGEGVECVDGIIGAGCSILYGSKALRFVMGPRSSLKYGARLIDSFLGDNSTVSCCEVLSSLIFPAHEQHHNNSFLIAALVGGQSNIAAGVTAGSNHNSRAPDGELHAGRGFWPGLCVSLKHNSRFASYCVLAKADYPAELDVRLPFCLVANDPARDALCLSPAWPWLHNMYALERNAWKFRDRDKRAAGRQHIEYEYLAPDTADEIVEAMRLLELWAGKEALRRDPATVDKAEVIARGVERSGRPCYVRKAGSGYEAYRDMLALHAARELVAVLDSEPGLAPGSLASSLPPSRGGAWVNMGGQIMRAEDADAIAEAIKSGAIASWDALHDEYDRLWRGYPRAKAAHALAAWLEGEGIAALDRAAWDSLLDRAEKAQAFAAEAVLASRAKDWENPFRAMCYSSPEEMRAVLGAPDANPFIKLAREKAEERLASFRRWKGRF
jgi:hypothetical protein